MEDTDFRGWGRRHGRQGGMGAGPVATVEGGDDTFVKTPCLFSFIYKKVHSKLQ